jgi:hypothetical protein
MVRGCPRNLYEIRGGARSNHSRAGCANNLAALDEGSTEHNRCRSWRGSRSGLAQH